ncbi:hypothetical protein BC936DRAFT_145987 [Jimgerdemannia flammicorona]|uniref:Uncharacterized protein n=1 Tax=Jimgerdemannia flammicorona TaxID=994334 RepID=A0A433DLU2_9FUNG|nr:hypothetical protein BC936DRAFT_145987 [Jimgerdemannia flammicorona]
MAFDKALKDFVVSVTLNLVPNVSLQTPLPTTTLTIPFRQGQLILDTVRKLMNDNFVPVYLETSILSTVHSVMLESHRLDLEKLPEAIVDPDAPEEFRTSARANAVKNELVEAYQNYTMQFHNKAEEASYLNPYHTLVHSPVSSIFDTLLELEQNYALSIDDLVKTRDKEIADLQARSFLSRPTKQNPPHIYTHLFLLFHANRQAREIDFISNPAHARSRHMEDIEIRQATWASEIHQNCQTHRSEYRDFVVQLYQEHQIRLSALGPSTSRGPSPSSSSVITAGGAPPGSDKIDGKEIVAAAMNRMRSWALKRSDSNEALAVIAGVGGGGPARPAHRRKSSANLVGLQIEDFPVEAEMFTATPTREQPEVQVGSGLLTCVWQFLLWVWA